MSDLTRFRDHCRERADWQPGNARAACLDRTSFGTPKPADHANCGGGDCGCTCHEPTDRERALFRQLAAEIDEYLTTEDEPLWEGEDAPQARTFARSGDYSGDVGTDTSGDLLGAQIGAQRFEGDDA